MMIGILFVVQFVLAFLHLMYEGIFAPQIKSRLRFELIMLKCRLREIGKSVHSDNREVFRMIENNIEWAIENAGTFYFTKICSDRMRLPKDKLIAMMSERNRLVEESDEPQLHEIVDLLDEYLFKTLKANCGGLIFWISPFIFLYYASHRFTKMWPDRLRLGVRSFVFVPEIS